MLSFIYESNIKNMTSLCAKYTTGQLGLKLTGKGWEIKAR